MKHRVYRLHPSIYNLYYYYNYYYYRYDTAKPPPLPS